LLAAEIAGFVIYTAAACVILLTPRRKLPIRAFAASVCGCISIIAGLFATAVWPQSSGWSSIPAVTGSFVAAWVIYRALPAHVRTMLLYRIPNLARRPADLMEDRP